MSIPNPALLWKRSWVFVLNSGANASGIIDGVAAVMVMSRGKADEHGLSPLCSIKSYASAGVDPSIIGIGPVPAGEKA